MLPSRAQSEAALSSSRLSLLGGEAMRVGNSIGGQPAETVAERVFLYLFFSKSCSGYSSLVASATSTQAGSLAQILQV